MHCAIILSSSRILSNLLVPSVNATVQSEAPVLHRTSQRKLKGGHCRLCLFRAISNSMVGYNYGEAAPYATFQPQSDILFKHVRSCGQTRPTAVKWCSCAICTQLARASTVTYICLCHTRRTQWTDADLCMLRWRTLISCQQTICVKLMELIGNIMCEEQLNCSWCIEYRQCSAELWGRWCRLEIMSIQTGLCRRLE